MFELPSNVVEGLALNPLPGEGTDAWLTIYLERFDSIQDVIVEYWNDLLSWDQLGAQTPDFILDGVGQILGQARPDGSTDDEYKRILIIRRLVRLSSGTQPDVRRVVAAIGEFAAGSIVSFLTPHTVIVTFSNFAQAVAAGLTLPVVAQLLLDAVQDVDRLQIWDNVGNPFTWDEQGKGWSQGVWSTPLFDSQD